MWVVALVTLSARVIEADGIEAPTSIHARPEWKPEVHDFVPIRCCEEHANGIGSSVAVLRG